MHFQAFQAFLHTVISEKSMMVCISQIIGTYFLSSIVLLARKLPLKQRISISDILMSTANASDIDSYFRWFDSMFIVSCILTLVSLIYFNAKMRSWSSAAS